MSKVTSASIFSPEWFREKAKEDKYIALADQLRKELAWFNDEYGVEKLRQLSGKDLLNHMFYNDTEEFKKKNLCYTLEMNSNIRDHFGSISGGSSFKFGLFFHNQQNTWMTGISKKSHPLTEEEAIKLGTEIRDNLVAGADEILNFGKLESAADYDELRKRVENHIKLNAIWVLKYYMMIFPDLFAPVYSEVLQYHQLYALQIQPADSQFVRMGQISLFSRQANIMSALTTKLVGETIGWMKPVYRIGTGQGKGKTAFPEWKDQGFCALGFDELGKFSDYLNEKGEPDKAKISSALLEHNDTYNQATATRKANEIANFMSAGKGQALIVAMDGQNAYGIGQLAGDLYFVPDAPYGNRRKVEWLHVFDEPYRMPVFEGKLTSFVEMSNSKNMMEIYRFLYHSGDESDSSDWWPSPEEYDPGISSEKWTELLAREDVFGPIWRGALAAFYLHGPATCTEIGKIYGKTPFSVSGTCTNLAKKIQSVTGCPVSLRENGQNRYWTILFQGRGADKDQDGSYIWKLRPEVYEACKSFDIEKYEWPVEKTEKAWLLRWHPSLWNWENYDQWIENVSRGIREEMSWSCSNSNAAVGDRIFLSVCGKEFKRGIIASGEVTGAPRMLPHWDPEKREQGKEYRAVIVKFDRLVDYRSDEILPVERLKRQFPDQSWEGMSSGIEIKPEYVKDLCNLWYSEQEKEIRFQTGYSSAYSRNRIVFGAPGTGKSYLINQDKDKLLQNGGSFERVTFHPDYSYAHFVGTYKPVPSDGGVTYSYVPGPFMRVLVSALENSRQEEPKPFLLIVEEINRANAAAVFGDVFQLLDRDENDVSEYAIQPSEDMKKYLAEELGGLPEDYSEIRLPDNMFIWATMNSADQGVFPMDTAFKRRWDFSYLNTNSGEAGIVGKKVILGSGAYERDVEWNTLRRAINDRLSSLRINEDKLIGPYFLSRKIVPLEGEINPAAFSDAFQNKVLMYLFEDAARQKRASLFADGVDVTRFSSVCEAFDERGVFVFCTEISSQFPLDDQTDGDEV